jgi:tetrahydromethanopterin S-methyltransferase subunit F
LQREYLLLKKQAAIDWKAMYADKHTSVTVQSIVEDYVYNAQLTARTQRMFTKIKIIIVVAGVITATSVFAFDLMIWEAAAIALLVCLCVCAWWHARKEKDRQLVERKRCFAPILRRAA